MPGCLVTADADFDDLCDGEGVTYVNPTPAETRERLTLADG